MSAAAERQAMRKDKAAKFRAFVLETTKKAQTSVVSFVADRLSAASVSRKHAAGRAASAADDEDDESADIPLSDTDGVVADFLSCVEQSLLFGIRWNAAEGWHGQARCWVCIRTRFQSHAKRAASGQSGPLFISSAGGSALSSNARAAAATAAALLSDFQTVDALPDLRENALKMRAWLRLSLNTNHLSEAIDFVFADKDLVK
jgi:hypothetical protein